MRLLPSNNESPRLWHCGSSNVGIGWPSAPSSVVASEEQWHAGHHRRAASLFLCLASEPFKPSILKQAQNLENTEGQLPSFKTAQSRLGEVSQAPGWKTGALLYAFASNLLGSYRSTCDNPSFRRTWDWPQISTSEPAPCFPCWTGDLARGRLWFRRLGWEF